MSTEEAVKQWFAAWDTGSTDSLPITDDFKHTSPFGTIEGKKAYLDLVEKNQDKFLGYHFEIHDRLHGDNHACVRYTAVQGDFGLDVSEWYYFRDGLIAEIIAYYHIGEVRADRQLKK